MSSIRKSELQIVRTHPIDRHFLAESVLQIAWHPSRDVAAVITSDGDLHLVSSTAIKSPLAVTAHALGALFVVWSPSGEMIATSGQDGVVRLWDPLELRPVDEFALGKQWVEHLAWASPRRLAAAMGRQIYVIDVALRQAMEIGIGENTITGLAWRNASNLVVTSYGQALSIDVDQDGGATLNRFDYPEAMLKMALSPDRRLAAIGCQDAAARVWTIDQDNDALQMSGYQEKVQILAWDGAGDWLALSGGNQISVWGFSGHGPKETRAVALVGHQTVVTTASFAAQGTRMASADKDGMLCFWDVSAAKAVPASIGLNKSAIHSLAWDCTGKFLLTGDQDGSIALWRTSAAYRGL